MKNLGVLFLLLAGLSIDSMTVARAERPQPPPMDATMKAAVDACATEKSLPKPEDGTRPTREQMKAMHDCVAAKYAAQGLQAPSFHHRGPRPDENQESVPQAPPAQGSSGSSSANEGVQ